MVNILLLDIQLFPDGLEFPEYTVHTMLHLINGHLICPVACLCGIKLGIISLDGLNTVEVFIPEVFTFNQ